jgi:D-alanine transaminase
MSRVAFVNGRYLPWKEAKVSFEDRGYQFADGVYEVCEVRDGCIVDLPRHLGRLRRSLSELRIAMPMSEAALGVILREVRRRNHVDYGIVYLQITRGVARRDHAFPPPGVRPSLVVSARKLNFERNQATAARGIAVITVPETRWARVDIKAVSLLPNVLARQTARERGAYEAWFVDDEGFVTEGAASNAWIVTADGRVVTHPTGHGILTGITRQVLIEVIASLQLALEERPFTVAEALAAREAFVTAASQIVMPVIAIDAKPIGDGKPGPIARRLREAFHRFSVFSC